MEAHIVNPSVPERSWKEQCNIVYCTGIYSKDILNVTLVFCDK